MDDALCPTCEHAWDMHPGLNLSLSVCGECVYEEDHDVRADEDMCTLEPPGVAEAPVRPGRLQARVARSLLGHYRVDIRGDVGLRWATVMPAVNSRESAEQTAATVEADIASLPLRELRYKYLGSRK